MPFTFFQTSRHALWLQDQSRHGRLYCRHGFDLHDKTEVETGVEAAAAARPDAVILKTIMADKLGKPLESLGLKVVYLDLEMADKFKSDLVTLGQFFQDEARAKQVAAFYQDRTDRIAKAVEDVKEEQKPRVLLLYYNDRDAQVAFNVAPMTYIQTLMVQMAGSRPAWKDAQLGQGWTKVNLEQIAAWDADQIYVVAYTKSSSDVVKQLKADPQWQPCALPSRQFVPSCRLLQLGSGRLTLDSGPYLAGGEGEPGPLHRLGHRKGNHGLLPRALQAG
jgi:ABC-type Fe3+-hydroxamate transport system substrate-binding protein